MNVTIAKWLFIAGTLFFADWLLMVLIGSFAHLCKADESFFCSEYCIIGITLLIVTALLAVYFSRARAVKKE